MIESGVCAMCVCICMYVYVYVYVVCMCMFTCVDMNDRVRRVCHVVGGDITPMWVTPEVGFLVFSGIVEWVLRVVGSGKWVVG
jgi:hypothetical protein